MYARVKWSVPCSQAFELAFVTNVNLASIARHSLHSFLLRLRHTVCRFTTFLFAVTVNLTRCLIGKVKGLQVVFFCMKERRVQKH